MLCAHDLLQLLKDLRVLRRHIAGFGNVVELGPGQAVPIMESLAAYGASDPLRREET